MLEGGRVVVGGGVKVGDGGRYRRNIGRSDASQSGESSSCSKSGGHDGLVSNCFQWIRIWIWISPD